MRVKLQPTMKFIKRRIPVLVTFAAIAGEMATLEGRVSYEAGDALMTGNIGERWPIIRATFETTYEPVPPLPMGEDGHYIKKLIPVEARQMVNEGIVVLEGQRGELQARSGDWIVIGSDGKQWVVAEAIFRNTYQALDEEQEKLT
jgi:hypothetical protein